jgi:hypothetical protein
MSYAGILNLSNNETVNLDSSEKANFKPLSRKPVLTPFRLRNRLAIYQNAGQLTDAEKASYFY